MSAKKKAGRGVGIIPKQVDRSAEFLQIMRCYAGQEPRSRRCNVGMSVYLGFFCRHRYFSAPKKEGVDL